jgi:hypothetical protein
MSVFGQIAAQIGGKMLDGGINRIWNYQSFVDNAQLAREFANHGIQWRVADAKAAGIHPAIAVGAPPTNAPAQQVNYQTQDALALGDIKLKEALANKYNAEAVQAMRGNWQMRPENQAMYSGTIPPNLPSQDKNIRVVPKESITRQAGDRSYEAGDSPMKRYVQTGPNRWKSAISKDMEEAAENDPSLKWGFFGSQVGQYLRGIGSPWSKRHRPKPPSFSPGRGKKWEYDSGSGEWVAYPKKRSYIKDRFRSWQKYRFGYKPKYKGQLYKGH